MSGTGKPPALKVEGLYRDFGAVKVLQGIDLQLAPGETVGILGPNGAGKSTMINCLSGVLTPSAGRIAANGEDITKLSATARARRGIVRTFQNLRLFAGLSAEENVMLGLGRDHNSSHAQRVEQVRATLEEHGLSDFAHRRTRELAYGVQRRVEIARALISRPSVLLLDEPGAGLGHAECELLSKALRHARESFGCAIVLIDHNVPFVAGLSDRMVLLAQGRIMRDAPPSDLLSDPIVADLYLGRTSAHAEA